ncbi:hypothetical protein KBB25_01620 [Candidatus Gracilibacteria bacterium]|nr:hypothetical protein [Candidatus Gracilibacteria bacterium]
MIGFFLLSCSSYFFIETHHHSDPQSFFPLDTIFAYISYFILFFIIIFSILFLLDNFSKKYLMISILLGILVIGTYFIYVLITTNPNNYSYDVAYSDAYYQNIGTQSLKQKFKQANINGRYIKMKVEESGDNSYCRDAHSFRLAEYLRYRYDGAYNEYQYSDTELTVAKNLCQIHARDVKESIANIGYESLHDELCGNKSSDVKNLCESAVDIYLLYDIRHYGNGLVQVQLYENELKKNGIEASVGFLGSGSLMRFNFGKDEVIIDSTSIVISVDRSKYLPLCVILKSDANLESIAYLCSSDQFNNANIVIPLKIWMNSSKKSEIFKYIKQIQNK